MSRPGAGAPLRIRLSDDRRGNLLASVQRFRAESSEEPLSAFRAGELLDFFVAELGPPVYNQGVQHARGYLMEKLDELEGDVYEPDRT